MTRVKVFFRKSSPSDDERARSWADPEEAEYTAYCAPGISEVDNKLAVTD